MENNTFFAKLALNINWQERLKREMPFIEEKIGLTGGKRICDIGGGAGYHALFLQEKGYDTVLVDKDEESLNIAKGNGVKNIVSSEFLDFHNKVQGSFDFIMSLGNAPASMKKQEFQIFLNNCFNLLNPGGIFFSQILNFDYISKQEYFIIASRSEPDFHQLRIARQYDSEQMIFQFVTTEYKTGIVSDRKQYFTILKRDFIQDVALNSGFDKSDFYADYNGNPHDTENGRDTLFLLYKSSKQEF